VCCCEHLLVPSRCFGVLTAASVMTMTGVAHVCVVVEWVPLVSELCHDQHGYAIEWQVVCGVRVVCGCGCVV